MPVRFGIAGLGRFGRVHARALLGLGQADVVALVDVSDDVLADAKREVPQLAPVRCWTNLPRALKESDAQAWVVATTTSTHVTVTREILSAGKNVLLEKPIADDLDAARTLAPLVRPDSNNLMLGHVMLFNSEVRRLLHERRQRGPVRFINSARHRPTVTLQQFPGENPLYLTMVHDLYVVQALVERAEPIRFDCRFGRNSQSEIDLAAATIQWNDGTVASVTASYLTTSGMCADGIDWMDVFGAGWVARIRTNPRPIELWDDRAHWPLGLEFYDDPAAPSGMLAEELRCFCRVVRGQESVPTGATYSDAMQVENWLQRLELSGKQQQC